MIENIVNFGVCLLEGYIYFYFWNNFLKLRVTKAWIPIALMLVAMGSLFVVNQMHIAGWNLAASLVITILVCQVLFSASVGKKVFYVLLSYSMMACCEFVMMIIASLPLGKKAIDYSSDSMRLLLLIIFTKLLTLLVCRLVCHWSNHGKDLFFSSLAPYFYCFPIACLVIYIGVAYSDISFAVTTLSNTILMMGCLLLLVANAVLFILYDQMVYMVNQVKEYEIMELKSNLENQHYLHIEEVNQKHKAILHDMNGYLKTIETLAKEKNNEEIVRILTSLNKHIVETKGYYCNHPILNAILNDKKQEAELKQIKYQVEVEPGFEIPGIEDIDLISIMRNLIDNAIEAAEKCQPGIVSVKLFQANDGKFTTIKIENNYKEEPIGEKGEFRTRKANPSMHGIGIRHVKSIVKRYGGMFEIEYANFQFCVTVMLMSKL